MNIQKRRKPGEKEVIDEDKQLSYFYSLLELVSTESLLRCMNKLAEMEDYEIAALYRNELIRRGKLIITNDAVPHAR